MLQVSNSILFHEAILLYITVLHPLSYGLVFGVRAKRQTVFGEKTYSSGRTVVEYTHAQYFTLMLVDRVSVVHACHRVCILLVIVEPHASFAQIFFPCVYFTKSARSTIRKFFFAGNNIIPPFKLNYEFLK